MIDDLLPCLIMRFTNERADRAPLMTGLLSALRAQENVLGIDRAAAGMRPELLAWLAWAR